MRKFKSFFVGNQKNLCNFVTILYLITIRLYAEGEILRLRVLRGDFFIMSIRKFGDIG